MKELVDKYREMLKNTPCRWKLTFFSKHNKVKVLETGREIWEVYTDPVEFEKFCVSEINFWLSRAKEDKISGEKS